MDKKLIRDNAIECKKHLEKVKRSVSDVYYDISDKKEVIKIFREVLGEELLKRVTFLPK